MKERAYLQTAVGDAQFRPPSLPGIELVMGFSCAGKSFFMRHLCTEVPGYEGARSVHLRDLSLDPDFQFCSGDILHMDLSSVRAGAGHFLQRPAAANYPHGLRILRQEKVTNAFILVTSEKELRQRLETRKVGGIGFRRDCSEIPYNGAKRKAQLNLYPLVDFYTVWLEQLLAHGVPYQFIRSYDGRFERIDDEEALSLIAPYGKLKTLLRFLRRCRWGFERKIRLARFSTLLDRAKMLFR